MVALGYTWQSFGPLRNLGQFFRVIQTAMAGAERVFAILDTVLEGSRTGLVAVELTPITKGMFTLTIMSFAL